MSFGKWITGFRIHPIAIFVLKVNTAIIAY